MISKIYIKNITSIKLAFIICISLIMLNCSLFISPALSQGVDKHKTEKEHQSPNTKDFTDIDKIISSSQLTINTAQTVITFVQTLATWVSLLVAAIGVVSFGLVLLYRNKIERTEIKLRETVDNLHSLKNIATELEDGLKNIKERADQIDSFLKDFEIQKEDIIRNFKNLKKDWEALRTASLIKDPKPEIRLKNLQQLSQLVHPVGILPMIDILSNNHEDPVTRAEAAHGLGRYSEKKDLEEFWSQILENLRVVLDDKGLSDVILYEAIPSVAKYGTNARALFLPILDWSKNSNHQIRLVCAEAIGITKVYDHAFVQRLKEMIASDNSTEVRKAAETSLKILEENRELRTT